MSEPVYRHTRCACKCHKLQIDNITGHRCPCSGQMVYEPIEPNPLDEVERLRAELDSVVRENERLRTVLAAERSWSVWASQE